MLPLLHAAAPRSALDIGCNIGWYSVKLASLGIPTVGVEGYAPYYRSALYTLRRTRPGNVAVCVMTLDEENVRLLPHVDCTLFLAVWHHLVRHRGLDEASTVLGELWSRTGNILFFESGQQEMGPEFRLPEMAPDARTWLSAYLGDVCKGGSVRHLGLHHGGNGGGKVAWRDLFVVVREAHT